MSIGFATPWLLLGLLAVPLLAFAARWLRGRSGPAALRFSDTSMAAAPASWRTTLTPGLRVLRLLAVALVVVAAARPQTSEATELVKGEGVDIALALDISGSMSSLDFQPNNRLDASKEVIGDFIESRGYDRIGLVVFAGEAFVSSPPTIDHSALQGRLDEVQLAEELRVEDGTAIGLGLATAANMLKDSTAESRVVVLLTDGANNAGQVDPFTAAVAVEALGIKVYAIGAGQPGLVPFPAPGIFGERVIYRESDLDEETLRRVAELTDGKYFRATDAEGLRQVYDEIDALEKSEVEVQVFTRYQELAAWALVPAVLLLLLEALLGNTVLRRAP